MEDLSKDQIDKAFLFIYDIASKYVNGLENNKRAHLLAYLIAKKQISDYLSAIVKEEKNAAFDSYERMSEYAEETIKTLVEMVKEQSLMLQAAPAKARADTARDGGSAKSQTLDPIRIYCRELYSEQPQNKKHQTKLKAIRERVITFAREQGKHLSYDQFIRTASGWVSDLRESSKE